ncbi:MAG TPA: hypothetical protein VFB76_08985 [Candidatus Angelobacter sp.]|nr:hypothetical protein [Candidatus Angelobacter sp.]
MKIAWSLVTVLYLASSINHKPIISAKMGSVSTAQCRQGNGRYDLHVGGTIKFTNVSNHTLLLPKKIDVVRTFLAASSMEEALRKKYVFVMNQEFGGSVGASVSLEDFIALKTGANALADVEPTVVTVTADSNSNPSEGFGPGTYWVRLEFATIPAALFFHAKELAVAKKTWRASGTLVDSYVMTEPFRLDVAPDPKAPTCESVN